MRYGTSAGCDIHRFNADAIETAITTAILDFYNDPGDVIDTAIAEYQPDTRMVGSSRIRQPE